MSRFIDIIEILCDPLSRKPITTSVTVHLSEVHWYNSSCCGKSITIFPVFLNPLLPGRYALVFWCKWETIISQKNKLGSIWEMTPKAVPQPPYSLRHLSSHICTHIYSHIRKKEWERNRDKDTERDEREMGKCLPFTSENAIEMHSGLKQEGIMSPEEGSCLLGSGSAF